MAENIFKMNQSPFFDRSKLLIMMSLISTTKPISFLELSENTQLTKGNLSSHLQKLEAEKLIKISKQFLDKKPLTTLEITSKGKKALNDHLNELQSLIKQVKI